MKNSSIGKTWTREGVTVTLTTNGYEADINGTHVIFGKNGGTNFREATVGKDRMEFSGRSLESAVILVKEALAASTQTAPAKTTKTEKAAVASK